MFANIVKKICFIGFNNHTYKIQQQDETIKITPEVVKKLNIDINVKCEFFLTQCSEDSCFSWAVDAIAKWVDLQDGVVFDIEAMTEYKESVSLAIDYRKGILSEEKRNRKEKYLFYLLERYEDNENYYSYRLMVLSHDLLMCDSIPYMMSALIEDLTYFDFEQQEVFWQFMLDKAIELYTKEQEKNEKEN